MIAIERCRADEPDVAELIAIHVAAMDAGDTPAEACHRFEIDQLLASNITMVAARDGARTVGIAALADYTDQTPPWAELKSMHVLADQRGRGISRLLLAELEQIAQTTDATELRLETGRSFAAAVGLYRQSGFSECPAFGAYVEHPASLFMSKQLTN